ncbi:HigA family addiction module antitoxin [Gramella sp. GC03-9]|uniref:HigA family addiction module antitoxin n=1 Tax=Christiangramia oceanisediminis TaxID=2920386 RepID=A0A9X2KWA4_9FLAO|nr:HigA family addiction module antitoxin [Gramella oceanisediminis]MCP9199243.1 HigA family addiction module antitoxin [Gramella oceanisediminis]
MDRVVHPGKVLAELMTERNVTQRELSAKIDIAHSLLSNILNGTRNFNVNHALALEAAGFKEASYWLELQAHYSIYEAKKNKTFQKRDSNIKDWKKIDENNLVPLTFLKKQPFLDVQSSEDVSNIYKLFNVSDYDGLKSKIENYDLYYFRKSSKFAEEKNNVITWSIVAEAKAKLIKVGKFRPIDQENLINELKEIFFNNTKVIERTKKLLRKYGIKFFTLDRPPKTPVEGKTFMSDGSPAIALSLRYKRLDYFAFTLMHELGHVYLHLTNPDYMDANFFINNAKQKIEEFQADNFAQDNLIQLEEWNDFVLSNDHFSDEVIYEFSKKVRVHPGIIRGRVCFENPEYYRKRTSITAKNKLTEK